jgi:hypothetical protein
MIGTAIGCTFQGRTGSREFFVFLLIDWIAKFLLSSNISKRFKKSEDMNIIP